MLSAAIGWRGGGGGELIPLLRYKDERSFLIGRDLVTTCSYWLEGSCLTLLHATDAWDDLEDLVAGGVLYAQLAGKQAAQAGGGGRRREHTCKSVQQYRFEFVQKLTN